MALVIETDLASCYIVTVFKNLEYLERMYFQSKVCINIYVDTRNFNIAFLKTIIYLQSLLINSWIIVNIEKLPMEFRALNSWHRWNMWEETLREKTGRANRFNRIRRTLARTTSALWTTELYAWTPQIALVSLPLL